MDLANIVVGIAMYELVHMIALCWIVGRLTGRDMFQGNKLGRVRGRRE